MKTFFIFFLLLSLPALSKGGLKKYPLREVSIILGSEGYYPQKITIFEGEKVRFYLTSSISEGSCLLMESPKLFLAANRGKISEGEVIFEEPGEYQFYCPNVKEAGRVIVLPKKRPQREIASQETPKSQVWMPKD